MINKIILTIVYLFVSGCSSCDSNPLDDDSNTPIAGCTDSTANNYNANATSDDGSCTSMGTDNHPINSLWFVPNSNGTWGVGYYSNIEIGGLQLTISGANIISVISGDAQDQGFSVTANEGSGIILGFSFSGATIPAGIGKLFSLELDGTPTEITEIIISDGSANSVPFTFEATYFSSILNTTGISKLTIFSSSISTLEVGDEIGIFDSNGILNYNDCSNQIGELLVGSSTWQGEQLNIVSIGSVDYCDIGEVQLSGFQLSNPIIIKIWDVSEQTLKIAAPEYSSGSGLFSDVLTVISELSF